MNSLKIKSIDWQEELDKCLKSPYYFYTNYVKVQSKDGVVNATTLLSEEDFNKKYFKKDE